jgi:DNA-binding NtrC family response regulator
MSIQVLVVDDDEIVRRAIADRLAERGMTVFAATTVEEARRFLASRTVDAILLDIWLGRSSGFELYAWIEEYRPDLADRVAFVSGEIADQVAHRQLSALGRPLVPKPFESTRLFETLSDLAPGP